MNFEGIEELVKAKRDLSKLVQVRRPIVRNGKTIMTTMWVLPAQVKKTDVVVNGQQNLVPAAKVAAPAAGVFDKKYFDYLCKDKDKQKALDYLISVGVVTPLSGNVAIDYMRAKMKLNSILKQQPSLLTTSGKIASGGNLGKNGGAVSTQPNSQAQPTSTHTAQNTTKITQQTTSTFQLNPSQQSEYDALTSNEDKLKWLKKNLSKDELVQWAKSQGLTWSENAHEAINIMRCTQAIKKHFGIDDKKSKKATSPTSGDGINDGTKQPDNLLKIEPSMTDREKALVEHINKMTNVKTMSKCAKLGIIPEDEISEEFITDKMFDKYEKWLFSPSNRVKRPTLLNMQRRWDSLQRKIEGGLPIGIVSDVSDFSDSVKNVLKIRGYNSDLFSKAVYLLHDELDEFTASSIIEPLSQLSFKSTISKTEYQKAGIKRPPQFNLSNMIDTLNSNFSDYTTDEFVVDSVYGNLNWYTTNKGYTGLDSEVYKKRYDSEKEGFVRYLRKIQDSTNNKDVKSKCEEMIGKYNEIMSMVSYNPSLLKFMNLQKRWDSISSMTDSTSVVDFFEFGKNFITMDNRFLPSKANYYKDLSSKVETIADVLIDKLKSEGLTNDQIMESLASSSYMVLNDLGHITIFYGANKLQVSIEQELKAKIPIGYDIKHYLYVGRHTDALQGFIAYKFAVDNGMDTNVLSKERKSYEWMKMIKDIGNFSTDDYIKLNKLQTELLDFQFENSDDKNKSPVNLHSIDGEFPNNYCIASAIDEDKRAATDFILSNMYLATFISNKNNRLASYVNNNPRSKYNNGGGDFSGNFDYYSPNTLLEYCSGTFSVPEAGKTYREKSRGCPISYSISELSDKVSQQLKDLPIMDYDYVQKVKDLYKNNGQTREEALSSSSLNCILPTSLDFSGNPLSDVSMDVMRGILINIPSMRGNMKSVEKRLNYEPFNFSKYTQQNQNNGVSNEKILELREILLKEAKCSIAVESDDVSEKMRKQILTERWDYRAGETNPDGTPLSGRKHSGPNAPHGDQRVLFNSRFFRINNSVFEEPFHKKQEALKSEADPRTREVMELFHGTSYGGTAGVLGNKFFVRGENVTSGAMLGPGAYFGYKGGKSSVYVGEDSYSNRNYIGSQGDNANGCFMLCSVMRGNNFIDSKSYSDNYNYGKSSVSASSNRSLNDWEIAVRDNDLILPHHFVDVSSRSLRVNVFRDTDGNYIDDNGTITHDKYGKSVNMK